MRLCKAVGWIQNAELVVATILLLLCVGGAPFGIKTYAVLSGSMEPAIVAGSLAYVDTDLECNEVAEGDVIVFKIDDNKVVTHRVVENDIAGQVMITKGDANEDVDLAPVAYGSVVGETVFSLPLLGSLLMAFKSCWVWALGIVVSFNVALCLIASASSRKMNASVTKEGTHHE